MSKIFDIDFRKGTLMDSVTSEIGVNNNAAAFKQIDKGKAINFDSASSQYIGTTKDYSGYSKLTVVVWMNKSELSKQIGLGQGDDSFTRWSIMNYIDDNLYCVIGTGTGVTYGNYSIINPLEDKCFIMQFDGTQIGNSATTLLTEIPDVETDTITWNKYQWNMYSFTISSSGELRVYINALV